MNIMNRPGEGLGGVLPFTKDQGEICPFRSIEMRMLKERMVTRMVKQLPIRPREAAQVVAMGNQMRGK